MRAPSRPRASQRILGHFENDLAVRMPRLQPLGRRRRLVEGPNAVDLGYLGSGFGFGFGFGSGVGGFGFGSGVGFELGFV